MLTIKLIVQPYRIFIMKTSKILSKGEYERVMRDINLLLKKATELGGFENLTNSEKEKLGSLSLLAEEYEDQIPLMPIKVPKTLAEMLRFKMYENDWKQKQLASLLDISEAAISGLLSGQRKLNFQLAKKLHTKLGIDAGFLLNQA